MCSARIRGAFIEFWHMNGSNNGNRMGLYSKKESRGGERACHEAKLIISE
jgi:hypothetical protein